MPLGLKQLKLKDLYYKVYFYWLLRTKAHVASDVFSYLGTIFSWPSWFLVSQSLHIKAIVGLYGCLYACDNPWSLSYIKFSMMHREWHAGDLVEAEFSISTSNSIFGSKRSFSNFRHKIRNFQRISTKFKIYIFRLLLRI